MRDDLFGHAAGGLLDHVLLLPFRRLRRPSWQAPLTTAAADGVGRRGGGIRRRSSRRVEGLRTDVRTQHDDRRL
ncbi:hypothetical protein ABZ876_35045 [Streptomyces sp. NPDC046931]|uniref:hypothetical protein n=1 Tax=Streptomyces sp. NPDC046931 TaxID=3154806 RepID=UPI003404D076